MNKIKWMLLLGMIALCGIANAHPKQKMKEGILLVTFGTSYENARVAFTHIEEQVKQEFPEVEIRWSYTSKMIRKILRKRGEEIMSPAEALAKMGEDGVTHVAVQSLHVIPGEEYENLKKTVAAFNHMPKGIQVARLGKPLLYNHADNEVMAAFLSKTFSQYIDNKSAVAFMGHGTHHAANIYYAGFQYYLQQQAPQFLLGTVEGYPELNEVIKELKSKGIKNVTLHPFMSVAGDHAQNDMAGSEGDSWKSVLEANGFRVKVILKGLAEYESVNQIWIDHLRKAFNGLKH
ncbi:sirohydrochlorin cobaltochelatase [Prolixibacteraceae bacterium JC049]|nr:sirohydrochlorin cobaltochelatase [Prolixibacteraceae bacterium JC049]